MRLRPSRYVAQIRNRIASVYILVLINLSTHENIRTLLLDDLPDRLVIHLDDIHIIEYMVS